MLHRNNLWPHPPMDWLRLARRAPLLAALLLALAAAGAARAADDLPVLRADANRTTVSGLSSGGFMAVQYGVAFSASVRGVGVIAGGPYLCAWLPVNGGIEGCMGGAPVGSASWGAALMQAALGQIDPAAGLAAQRIYLFSGTHDETVKPPVMAATRDFYVAAGVPPARLQWVGRLPAGHAFLAPDFGGACGSNGPPYIERCTVRGQPYDQPKAVLQHLQGRLKPPAEPLSATVRPFDQRAFGDEASGLDATGFVYVPQACQPQGRGCAVHVVFHGCRQGAAVVGSDVYKSAGYNRWADSNRLIVLYPQAVATEVPFNPKGCWDWWGYTSLVFATRSGVQLSAIHAMVERLTQP